MRQGASFPFCRCTSLGRMLISCHFCFGWEGYRRYTGRLREATGDIRESYGRYRGRLQARLREGYVRYSVVELLVLWFFSIYIHLHNQLSQCIQSAQMASPFVGWLRCSPKRPLGQSHQWRGIHTGDDH